MSCLKCLLLFLPVYLKKSLDVFPGSTHCLWCLSGLSSVSVNVFQSMSFQSVSQCLLSNLSTGATWCLSGSTHNLSSGICLVVRCVLSELDLNSANVFLVSSVDVFPKCLPMSFAKSVYRSHLMSFRINPQSFFQYLSNGFDAFCLSWFSIVSFCQCLPDENPADVFLDWALRLPMSFWWAQ